MYNDTKRGSDLMERIIYRKTLDVHKSGVQFTLQGFETADKASRRIEISLMASGDTIDLPLEQVSALMYVTTPNATEPSINECIIKDNVIIYDVLPIVEEGITEMQLKLIESRVDGAKGVLPSPRFAVEVSKSNTNDESATQTTTFTALENAIASAKSVYDERLLRIELDGECMFRAYYADGSVYESDVLKELFLKGDALLSQSYARGGTGVRAGEDTDNSMYYSNVSKSSSIEANTAMEQSLELLGEVRKHGVYTAFTFNFEKGELEYISPHYSFVINPETGELEAIGEAYSPEENIDTWLNDKTAEITETLANNAEIHSDLTQAIENESNTRAANDESLQNDITANYYNIAEINSWRNSHETESTEKIAEIDGLIATNKSSIETNAEGIAKNAQDISKNASEIEGAVSYADSINKRLVTAEQKINELDKTGAVLFEGGFIGNGELTEDYYINDIDKYSVVIVMLSAYEKIVCSVTEKSLYRNGETVDIYAITGVGCPLLEGVSVDNNFGTFTMVSIMVDKSTNRVYLNETKDLLVGANLLGVKKSVRKIIGIA